MCPMCREENLGGKYAWFSPLKLFFGFRMFASIFSSEKDIKTVWVCGFFFPFNLLDSTSSEKMEKLIYPWHGSNLDVDQQRYEFLGGISVYFCVAIRDEHCKKEPMQL